MFVPEPASLARKPSGTFQRAHLGMCHGDGHETGGGLLTFAHRGEGAECTLGRTLFHPNTSERNL